MDVRVSIGRGAVPMFTRMNALAGITFQTKLFTGALPASSQMVSKSSPDQHASCNFSELVWGSFPGNCLFSQSGLFEKLVPVKSSTSWLMVIGFMFNFL